jgi:hypothetical protein
MSLSKQISQTRGLTSQRPRKRDREIIEFAFHSKATELGITSHTQSRQNDHYATNSGSKMDDLDEGIIPFSVIIVDNTTSPGEAAYRTATKVALMYDDLTKRVGVPLADLDIVITTEAGIPDTFA